MYEDSQLYVIWYWNVLKFIFIGITFKIVNTESSFSYNKVIMI